MLTLTDLKMVVRKTAYKAWWLDFQHIFMMKQCVNTMSISIFQIYYLMYQRSLTAKADAMRYSFPELVWSRHGKPDKARLTNYCMSQCCGFSWRLSQYVTVT